MQEQGTRGTDHRSYELNKTPLHAVHVELGARMVPFTGWDMPVTYQDIETEHHAVRQAAGLFDLCHMGRVRFRGPDADVLAGRVLTLDTRPLKEGRTRYALVCEEDGGIRDDVLVSRESDGLLLVVNAGNREADLERFAEHAHGLDLSVDDESNKQAMVAIQGPASIDVLEAMGLPEARKVKYYRFKTLDSDFGPMILSRTGYTGEIGFEIFLPAEEAPNFWGAALKQGKAHGLIPCGLGARDTLRLEAGMPLHGHEIDRTVNPVEAGLDFALRSDLPHVGAEAIKRVQDEGPARKLIGLQVEGPRIPRQGYSVMVGDRVVGAICSGTRSPTLGHNIATALVEAAAASENAFSVQIRRATAEASQVPMPFYSRKKE